MATSYYPENISADLVSLVVVGMRISEQDREVPFQGQI